MNVTDTHAGRLPARTGSDLLQLFICDWRSVVVQVNELGGKIIRLANEPGHSLYLGVLMKRLPPVD